MLELLDGLLTVLVCYGVPVAIGLLGVSAAIAGLAVLCLGSRIGRLAGLGLCWTIAACCAGFFAWLAEFVDLAEGEPLVMVTLPLFFMMLALAAARLARAMGLPWGAAQQRV